MTIYNCLSENADCSLWTTPAVLVYFHCLSTAREERKRKADTQQASANSRLD